MVSQQNKRERKREREMAFIRYKRNCNHPLHLNLSFYVLAFNLDTSLAVEIGRDGLKAPSDDVNGIKTWELF